MHGNLPEMVLLNHQEVMMMRGTISSSDHPQEDMEIRNKLQENLLVVQARITMLEDDLLLTRTRLQFLTKENLDIDLVQEH